MRISITYAIVSLLWVRYTGKLVEMMTQDPENLALLENIKGYFFVLATSLILYFMIRSNLNKKNNIENRLLNIVNIIESSQDAIIGKDLKGDITSWNSGAEKIFGYKRCEVLGKSATLIFPRDKQNLLAVILSSIKHDELIENFRMSMIKNTGEEVSVSITISPIKDIEGFIVGVSSIARDITKLKKDEMKLKENYQELSAVYEQLRAAEEELRDQYEVLQDNQKAIRNSEERYKLALEGANDAMWEWELDSDRFYISDKWLDLTQFTQGEITFVKDVLNKMVYPEDRKKAFNDLKPHFAGVTPYYESEFRITTKTGERKWIYNRGKVLRNIDGKPYLMAGSMTDITERKKKEQQIMEMAYYDSVTGLPNRALFMDRLNVELNKVERYNNSGAVLFLDLDDFKRINDTMGHDYGDELLKVLGSFLKGCLRACDTVARFGGDEFLILLPEIKTYLDAVDVANRILMVFEQSFQLDGKQVFVTASIGLIMYPDDGNSANSILKNVDTAMYAAKANGKNRFYFFDKKISDAIVRRTEIEKGLRSALQEGELSLYFQPQVNIADGEIDGLESLLRWNSKELGIITPLEFIPIAEETGLIITIGEWVLRTACIQNKEWRDKGYKLKTVSVNVSAIQFQHKNFSDLVKKILVEVGLQPEFLEIEITESILMENLEENVSMLNNLRELGVKVALDDFGTGYSSLSYLRMLPINKLKIDKSFIDGICDSKNYQDITDGIIQLAHKMNLDVVVEGVEVKKQVEILQQMNCNIIQGYYFSKPLTTQDAEKVLKEGKFQI